MSNFKTQYLLDHYKEFDFIWSSPPCPTHSKARFWAFGQTMPTYPDMKLYQEILFLQHHCKSKWIVENVTPYYEPLIPAKKRDRHLYWSNFNLPNTLSERTIKITTGANEVRRLCAFHDYDFFKYKGEQRTNKIARNLVDYESGKTIFETVLGILNDNNKEQTKLF